MKDRIVNCFNKGAETYDAAAIVQMQIADRLVQHLSRINAQDILEIGCGTGLVSQQLLTHFSQADFLFTDISPSMIEVCKKRLGHHPRAKFACIDGEALSADASYDLIISSMTLHWFSNIEASFKKIMASLKPGGQFIFAMLGEHSLSEWRDICETFHFSIPTPVFPSHSVLQKTFPNMALTTDVLPHTYDSLYAFLCSLKNIGATSAHENHTPISSGKLRHVLRHFNKKITISYEVILGKFEKQ